MLIASQPRRSPSFLVVRPASDSSWTSPSAASTMRSGVSGAPLRAGRRDPAAAALRAGRRGGEAVLRVEGHA
jgi:hypothetical protein